MAAFQSLFLLHRQPLILVTGATGRIGGLVLAELLRQGDDVRALTRRPEAVSLPANAQVVAGDFTNPPSLDAALAGVDTVFLVWTPPLTTAAEVIDRIAAHCKRVVYLSAPFRTPHPFFQQPNPMRGVHEHVERLLSAADLDVAIVRPGMFASNALHWWAPQIRRGDSVRWPYANAATAPIDERDIAESAARVLKDARFATGDFVLTGPESLTQAEQVAIIGEAIERPIVFDELTPDTFRREAEGTWPPGIADMLMSAWKAALGGPAFVSQDVERILGRPPRTFRQWADDHRDDFISA